MPEIHELTNGRYKVRLTPRGAGQSLLDWIALNRWTGDLIEDRGGFLIFLRDLVSDDRWSATEDSSNQTSPTVRRDGTSALPGPQRQERLSCPADLASISEESGALVLKRSRAEIATELRVSVHPADDVEFRRLRVVNESDRARRIEITSCIEVALAHPMGDLSHPAFSKLFVQTALDESCGALIATRRPRSAGETWPAMLHTMTGAAIEAWETDRLCFIGRGRDLSQPAMQMRGTTGNVLDPVLSLRATVNLEPGSAREIVFILGAAPDPAGAATLVRRHAAGAQLEPRAGIGERKPGLRARGRFDETGRRFEITLPWDEDGLALPPMPWCNVIANERFGFLVSERGAACTWSRNSQANRLTPWSNDPVSDPHGEALYLRDEEAGGFWSPLPGPCPAQADCSVIHGHGFSSWSVKARELEHETLSFAAPSEPLKITRVSLRNSGASARRVTLFAFHRLVLGTLPQGAGSVKTWHHDGMLCARRAAQGEFSDGIAFCFAIFQGDQPSAKSHTCSRESFLGGGGMKSPAAMASARLDGRTGGGLDPCFAWAWELEIPQGQNIECAIILGEATGDAELEQLRSRYGDWHAVEAAHAGAIEFWELSLGRLQAKTPSAELDLLVNGWMARQALACRIWGRTAFYQSSGAFGFRDQLQDAGNLTLLWPGLARQQILLHAGRQFEEGDVLHWWHPEPIARGVRTRFSDDLLWLPFIAADYARSTGDSTIWDEIVPFLKAPALLPGEDEQYLKPETSDESASLFEHCCRAIDRSLTRGAHGLPLMGTGDWNDGMNRVGREGRGESVWLGFFLFQILGDFIPLARARGEHDRASRYQAHRSDLQLALDSAGWDGRWYRRAYYDDGSALGVSSASECRIDGLAQAWSVLSGAASQERASQAMEEAARQLLSEADGLIRLLTPPFENTSDDPGYIKGYVAGVRENGGQYTHAACWIVRAMASLGWRARAAPALKMLSPLSHCQSQADIERYKVEPYVIAADVYGAPPHVGRGGWTWYTGSAGWAFRVAVESVLGLRIEDGRTLVLRPCVPDEWPGYELRYSPSLASGRYIIHVQNPRRCSARIASASLDGARVETDGLELRVPLTVGEHHVEVVLGD